MAAALELTPGLKAQLEESATASSDAVIDAQGEIVKLTGRASGQATTPDAYFAALTPRHRRHQRPREQAARARSSRC